VIAFRGTHGTLGSVFSNVAPLSVFVRILMPGADHYEQVRLNVDNWVKELRNYGCQNARIVAVGHSLGGGLAKHAAYQNSRISRVYTFNTSPVTAWGFIDEERRARNVKGLEIENIVERGEFLGWARGPATLRYPARSCDPQERTITMDADTTSWAWGQHGIWPMAAKLQEWESRKRGTRRSEAGLPQLTAQEKAKLNCITEPRARYMARNDPDWIAERRAGPTVTVRATPAALRER
jgi:pimeloyl-ACP methyl ester carboxylesterase